MDLSFCYFQLLDASSQVKNQIKNSVLRLDQIGLSTALGSKPFQSAPGRLQFDPIFDLRDRHRSCLIRHKNHNFQTESVYSIHGHREVLQTSRPSQRQQLVFTSHFNNKEVWGTSFPIKRRLSCHEQKKLFIQSQ